jgi:hypothetical protein
MNPTAQRIVRRYLHGGAFIRLDPIPVIVADGGVISVADLESLLGMHGIEAHDVVLYRHEGDPPNVFRWAGRGGTQEVVRGQLVLHVNHDHKNVVVSAEIALAARYTSQERRDDRPTTEPMLPVKSRLMLIASIARRAIQDLRTAPEDLGPVLVHLIDIADIAEAEGWAVEP